MIQAAESPGTIFFLNNDGKQEIFFAGLSSINKMNGRYVKVQKDASLFI